MKLSDFDFNLDNELIAQYPSDQREHSRLLVVHKNTNELEDKYFYNIIDYLKKGDVLVLNDSKVIPARLFGEKVETKAKVELLILKYDKSFMRCLCGNAKVIKLGTIINIADKIKACCTKVLDEGIREFKIEYEGILLEVLESIGHTPLPPYIKKQLDDDSRYQNVYSKHYGSAACPTAGLHFSEDLLEKIKAKGIIICKLCLHVGMGTFMPVKCEDITKHKMHYEYYDLSQESAEILNEAKREGRRIIAVGTTSTRVLEDNIARYGQFKASTHETNIFIYPPYEFKAIDALITNFHLPKSSLIMMISAFYNRKDILKAYEHAIKNRYRFFSFGDSMFINNE